ncbi:MAG TPA: hypothetical protein VGF84_02215 [Micromonosporaceae bacterium]|jgi:hypothetical protein
MAACLATSAVNLARHELSRGAYAARDEVRAAALPLPVTAAVASFFSLIIYLIDSERA